MFERFPSNLEGIHSRLGYLELLGVDALWLTPFYRSPMADHGYDIADPRDVDPMFGTLGDFDVLLTEAHKRGIKVTVDVVPNHTSNTHAWFKAAMARASDSKRAMNWGWEDLMATVRLRRVSWAFQTSPMPPAPMGASSS